MLPEQRRRAILNDLAQSGTMTIPDLSEKYSVSSMTIRRDLKQLEQDGVITLTHGGAIYDGESALPREIFYPDRAQTNVSQKNTIARYIAEHFVDNGDVLILDPGTTIASMMPFLQYKADLTIITNGLLTVNAVHRHLPDATLICTGGILRDGSLTFVGPVAERYFADVFAHKIIISGAGMTPQTGLTDPQILDTAVKHAMIAAATECIVAIDSSKFGKTTMVQILKTSDIQVLVTDSDAPSDQVEHLRRLDIDVHVVDYSSSSSSSSTAVGSV